jgi:hypothetical protein
MIAASDGIESAGTSAPAMRQCGRCRQFFPADPGLHASAVNDWWSCPACHEAIIPGQKSSPGDSPTADTIPDTIRDTIPDIKEH